MRHHKDWIKAYIQHCSTSEAPDKFHFWTGVSTIAGALERKVWIDQAYFQWVPNFYIILVGPPGIVTKSTTISIGHEILYKLPEVTPGPQIITWQALMTGLTDAARLIQVSSSTFEPMSAVTFSLSELGTLLDTTDQRLLTLLTDLWDGKKGVMSKSTKTQGDDEVQNPWVNLIGCCTPSWLRDNVSENMMTGGLSSRIIWLWGTEKRHLCAYPKDHVKSTFEADAALLFEDLEEISTLIGECTLTADAKEWGKTWYEDHYKAALSKGFDDATSGQVARAQTHLHKLAMILSVARSSDLIIHKEHLQQADQLIKAVELTLPAIHDIIRDTPKTRLAKQLVEIVAGHTSIDMMALYKLVWSRVEYPDFRGALEAGQAAGYLEFRTVGARVMVCSTK